MLISPRPTAAFAFRAARKVDPGEALQGGLSLILSNSSLVSRRFLDRRLLFLDIFHPL